MNTLFYVVCIVAIVFTADTIQKYLKMKNQERKFDPELEETLANIARLEERIRVLERIVTENKTDLKSEIDRL
jgi:5'-deoxynucleotidase YfbR-like HD superfamily hydrolase